MRVRFLKDYGDYADSDDDCGPEPMYEKGEIAHLFDDAAEKLIIEGVVEKA